MHYQDNLMLAEGLGAASGGAALFRAAFPTIFAQ
jgi:hypothetical protein